MLNYRPNCNSRMFTSLWILGIVLFGALAVWEPARVLAQPSRFPKDITTCEEFERKVKFNPYDLVDDLWQIIYFWSNVTETEPVKFLVPSKKRIEAFKEVFESVSGDMGVNWNSAVLMMLPRPSIEVLFLYQGLGGAFRAVILQQRVSIKNQRPHPGPTTSFADVRMKIVENVLGMMCCEDLTAFAFIKVSDLPTTEAECALKASYIGYRGHPGRSYLTVRALQQQRSFKKDNVMNS